MRTLKFRAWDGIGITPPKTLHELVETEDELIPDLILMQFTGLMDKNGVDYIFEGDIIDSDGHLKGNKYETPNLLKEKTNLVIEGMGTKAWRDTEQKAMERGCKYSE